MGVRQDIGPPHARAKPTTGNRYLLFSLVVAALSLQAPQTNAARLQHSLWEPNGGRVSLKLHRADVLSFMKALQCSPAHS